MLESSFCDHDLVREVHRRQEQLWDDLESWLVELLVRLSAVGSSVDPRITQADLTKDLQFGRS